MYKEKEEEEGEGEQNVKEGNSRAVRSCVERGTQGGQPGQGKKVYMKASRQAGRQKAPGPVQ